MPQTESCLEESLCAGNTIKFCAVEINVSTKHSVSTMPVKKFKVYGRMASCPKSVDKWILMAGYYWLSVRRMRKKTNDFARAKG